MWYIYVRCTAIDVNRTTRQSNTFYLILIHAHGFCCQQFSYVLFSDSSCVCVSFSLCVRICIKIKQTLSLTIFQMKLCTLFIIIQFIYGNGVFVCFIINKAEYSLKQKLTFKKNLPLSFQFVWRYTHWIICRCQIGKHWNCMRKFEEKYLLIFFLLEF